MNDHACMHAMFFSVLPLLVSSALAAPAAVPNGGVGVRANDTPPVYQVLSDFDYQSFALGLNQEYIELDLFHYGVARFSEQEFAQAGMTPEDISLIEFMADQEVGHAALLTNIIDNGGRPAPKQCQYKYDFESVREFVAFSQALTRWGESGVYGFLPHLDSRPAAQLLLQSITTEARQQLIFRQFSGAHPMPVYFETGISQSMAWSLLSRYIISCPAENPRIEWTIFPAINVTNGKSITVDGYDAAITHNRTSLTTAGQTVELTWDTPGKNVSYNSSYTTATGAAVNASTQPAFVAFISQLNVTYSPLNVTGDNSGTTIQPGGFVFNGTDDSVVNGTSFIAITDTDLYVTPYNLSLLNDHILAFDIYQAD